MIGKIITGKSFKGCLQYCLHDKKQQHINEEVMKSRAEILQYNQCYGDAKELISQFNEVRALNPRLSKPVLHITLSLAPGEELPNDRLTELCTACAQDMGFENNQYIAIRHCDTKHQHIHIVANRIGFDGKTVSDSNSYRKVAQYCRKMEQRYQLREVLSPRQFLPKEQRHAPRQDARKLQLKKDMQQVLRQARTYREFEQRMQALGYHVLKGRGIAFRDKKQVYTKGSEIGFSLMKIEKILSLKKELENREAVEKIHWQVQAARDLKTDSLTPAQQLLLQVRHEQKQEHSSTKDLHSQLDKLLGILLKPEGPGASMLPELLKRKRRKKKQGPHL